MAKPDALNVLGTSVEAVTTADERTETRVRGLSVEAVTWVMPIPSTRVSHESVEVVQVTPKPCEWLPVYVWTGVYWLPLFPIAGTPHASPLLGPDGGPGQVVWRSPDGTRWRVSLGNDGALRTEEVE